MPRPSLSEARTLLRATDLGNLVSNSDYEYLRQTYLPAVRVLERSARRSDRRLAAVGLTNVADLCWIMDAPLAAIRYYRRSLKLDRDSYTLAELARRYAEIGRQSSMERVVKELEQGFRHDPNYLELIEDIKDGIVEIDYHLDSQERKASELLAKHQPKKALIELRGSRGSASRLGRAAAYSVLGETDSALREWKKLTTLRSNLYLGYGDWFYLREEIFENLKFWTYLQKLSPQLEACVFPGDESLPKRIKGVKRQRLVIEYHIVRISKDVKRARVLLFRYPRWKELKQLLGKFED